jgi:REP element-mobilizing transposase RayT
MLPPYIIYISGVAAMASYNQLYLHCVWATWDRLPLISAEIESSLYSTIAQKSKALGCPTIAIGGVHNHVHVLMRFSTTITIARLVGEIKGASSHAVADIIGPTTFFRWQGSYGAFSISKRSISHVRSYILNQKAHHAEHTLIAELEQVAKAEG